jgi:hypothetical protein
MPILKKPEKKNEHPDLDKTRSLIMAEMPIKTIVEVIAEVESWFKVSLNFKPLSGYETRIQDYPPG